jgi:coproporphyrinogen III oxidase-like Fe-S oxidoreductase
VLREKFAATIIQKVVKTKSKSSFKLGPIDLPDYPSPDLNKDYLLYIHVPFCKSFCSYCSFYKIKYNPKTIKAYFTALQADIKKAYAKGYQFKGVYIGGGTPTLAPEEVAETIDLLKSLYDIKKVSCEANPDIDDNTIKILQNRVNRLSVGIQSFEDSLISKSGRIKFGHSAEMVETISKAIGKFDIVNVDMIFNFFNQPKETLLHDLETLIKLSPHQIAYYPLMYSKYTKITKRYGGYSQKNEYLFYNLIMNTLNQEYDQVGSWSFTKKGGKFFDEYVVNHDEYLGLGAGAFSYIDNTLYANTFNVDEYIKNVERQQSTIKMQKVYKKKDQLKYRLMLRLFANEFSPERFKKNYGPDSIKILSNELTYLKIIGAFKSNSWSLTDAGKYYAMIMMKEFYIGMNDLRASLQ